MLTPCKSPAAIAALLTGLAFPVSAAQTSVAVAANFTGAAREIAAAFRAKTGHEAVLSFGASGQFYTQITQEAPFQVFLSADQERPKKLVADGLAVDASRFTYAIGKLVLWSAQPGYVDDQGAVLAAGKFTHLAIANPKLAPYGQAAMEVLKARGLADAIAPKLVTAESIAQAYQFVATGNAELGFVALSQVAPPGKPAAGSYWLVPASLYGEIRQNAVLLKTGAKNPAAAALLAYLKSAPAKAVIQAYGYGH